MPAGDKIIIVGGGPAGIAAAMQLKLSGLTPIILEKRTPGGLIECAHRVRNLIGFPDGISGRDVVHLLIKQLEHHKITVRRTCVHEVDMDANTFRLTIDSGTVESKYVVIASGTEPKPLPADIELHGSLHRFMNHPTVSKVHIKGHRERNPSASSSFENTSVPPRIYDDIRPLLTALRAHAGERVLIFGGGDLAFDYALSLHELGASPEIIMRSSIIKAADHLKQAAERSGIKVQQEFGVRSIHVGREVVVLAGDNSSITGDYLLLSIGRQSCIDFLSERLYKRLISSRLPNGLFLAGDVNRGIFRQAGIAAGDGMLAAMKIAHAITKLQRQAQPEPSSEAGSQGIT